MGKKILIKPLLFLILVGIVCFASDSQPALKNNSKKETMEYALRKYECEIQGIKQLYFPAKNPKRLWIIFSGHSHGYNLWSWFWNNEQWNETSYLFLTDPTNTWYLGSTTNPLVPLYSDIIKHYIKLSNLSPEQTFSIGTSMGGYAALLFGINLNFKGIFAIIPQLEWLTAQVYLIGTQLKDVWIDIPELAARTKKLPFIYMQEGCFSVDARAQELFMEAIHKRRDRYFVLMNKTPNQEHGPFLPTKELIEKTLLFFESLTFNENDLIPKNIREID